MNREIDHVMDALEAATAISARLGAGWTPDVAYGTSPYGVAHHYQRRIRILLPVGYRTVYVAYMSLQPESQMDDAEGRGTTPEEALTELASEVYHEWEKWKRKTSVWATALDEAQRVRDNTKQKGAG